MFSERSLTKIHNLTHFWSCALTPPLSAVFLGLRDPLWPEIFENLAVGLTFYAFQNGQQFFLKFDP